MDFKQINTFVTLAECLHFGHAAEQLGIAQPHVSRRIKQLEEDLGVALFDRDKRNVKLTRAGTVFLAEAHKMLYGAEVAREHTRESALGRRGRLDVSLIASAMLGALPGILRDFRERYPDVHLSFKELGTASQLEALANEHVDVAFVHPPPRANKAFDRIDLEREPLVAVVPSGHRLAGRRRISLFELSGDPWVMFPRENSTPIYDRIIALCHKAGFSPRIVQVAGPVPTRLGLVAAGFGVHLVHEAWAKMNYPGIAYVTVHPTSTIVHTCYWRKGDGNPVLKTFLDVVRQHRTIDRQAAAA